MKKIITLLKIIISMILISSCRIGMPPIEESPIFFLNNNIFQEEYCNVDSLIEVKLSIKAGYFIDSDYIFLDLKMDVENFGNSNIYLDNNSFKINSKNLHYEFIAMDPEINNLFPNTEYGIQIVLRSKNIKTDWNEELLNDELSSLRFEGIINGRRILIIDELQIRYLN